MQFQTEISYDIDKSLWDDALLLNPASTAFQFSDFYLPHQLTWQSKPVFITILNPTGKIAGQLSGVIHLTNHWRESNTASRFFNSRFNLDSMLRWEHGPIIHDPDHTSEILDNIFSAIDKIAYQHDLTLAYGTSAPQAEQFPANYFQKNGYTVRPWITYITDLQRNTDEIFQDLNKKTRYDIHKGEKSNLEFEILSDKESLNAYFEIKFAKNTTQKFNRYKELHEHLWDKLFHKGYEKIFLAKDNGKLQAAIINFLFNGNIWQSEVANSTIQNRYSGSFLTWNTIRWSAENNFKTYDLGGANPFPVSEKEKGISLFKSKWVSKKVEYFLFTKVYNTTKLNLSNIFRFRQAYNKIKSVKYSE